MKLYSVKVVAKWLNLSEKRIRQLRDEGILNETLPGLYDLQGAVKDYINYIKKDSGVDDNINYNTERARLVKVKRESEELELSLKKKELHNSEDIEKVMVDMLLKFKSRLMSMPSKLSPIMAKKTDKTEIFKIIKNYVYDALNELSDFETLFKEELGDGE